MLRSVSPDIPKRPGTPFFILIEETMQNQPSSSTAEHEGIELRTEEEKNRVQYVEHKPPSTLNNASVNGSSKGNAWATLKKNPKIVACCIFANLGALMYGFDNLALSICLSMPAFE